MVGEPVPTRRKREKSFAIIAEPPTSRPASPRSLPVEIKPERVSPFKGRGFREETSRHNTPKTSATNSRASSPPRRRTRSLSRAEKMAQTVTMLPQPLPSRPISPRNFLKENMAEVKEQSEMNREKHEAEAEEKRKEEEIALLKEMGILDKKGEIKSRVNSRTNSRSNSPSKIHLRSRSNSPSAILHYEKVPKGSSEFLNVDSRHRSRVRSVSRSQPESKIGSPKNSKIPKRQSSISPTRYTNKKYVPSNLNKNPKYISNSTSSIHETIRVGSQIHDKRAIQSTHNLAVPHSVIKGKPPISPGKIGPPPSNKTLNSKRLSPIVGTPNKSPIDDPKPTSARQTSRVTSRDPSPEKRVAAKTISKPNVPKPINRAASTKTTTKPPVPIKSEPKKPISRTNSTKNLSRIPSTKNLLEKPPLKKVSSKKDLSEKPKSASNKNNQVSENGLESNIDTKNESNREGTDDILNKNENDVVKQDEVTKQDNETQYDKITNEKGELVILTKKNIVSMTTAAITSQPLEVVTTVTNQLPNALEKAREKGIFERLNSKDSLIGKEDDKDSTDAKDSSEPTKSDKIEKEEKRPPRHKSSTIFSEDNVKLRLLQPPYNNPQLEKVKQKIEDILKEPEISPENILATAKVKETKDTFKKAAEKTKSDIKEGKDNAANKLTDLKNQMQQKNEEMTAEFRSEASKIVDSIITPVEQPKIVEAPKPKEVEPLIKVVSEKKNEIKSDAEKVTETLVQGEGEVEVQSSNLSSGDKIRIEIKKADATSDKSAHSNGGFPQSTSTTPKPPARAHRQPKEEKPPQNTEVTENAEAKPNICTRLISKCKSTCCPCCVKAAEGDETGTEDVQEKKRFWSSMNCLKKKIPDEEVERAAGKAATIEFESETKRKRKLRDVLCACRRRRKVSDLAESVRQFEVSSPVASTEVVTETGCCGKKKEIERRDSILSDQAPTTCCNNRLSRWLRGACRRQSEPPSSRRTSLFSKNKSLSPTLPPEDTRTKLDASLVEHTSVMRGAIPVLPPALAYFCLVCNVIVPGLGTLFSGMFCLCFGIPRFGVHDGAKHRIGSFVINLVVACSQLFTVLFCLVGWGWSIWWGVIMIKISRKYRKLKAEEAAEEAEAAPPVTANNHTRA
ncbi:unnamed protein product [Leptosia nina]|uniref:Protein stum n=1 Tax=Leptosia nina TaxID=320188 RepID=A0AAV1JLP1_9NEOP